METINESPRIYHSYEEYRESLLQETLADRIRRSIKAVHNPKEMGEVLAKVTLDNVKKTTVSNAQE